MADIQKGYTFTNGETVTPAKLHALVDDATVADGTIGNSKISASAAIAHSKLANIPAGQVLLGNASNIPTATALSGDVTVSNTGAVTIANNAVTSAKLSSSIVFVPAGAVMPFAMNSAPSGWLIANGNVVPNGTGTVQGVTANFSALYAAVSNSFGPAGTLPDLRGYFIRGFGTNSDTTASAAFGVKQEDEFKSHVHSIPILQQASGGGTGAFLNLSPNTTTNTNATGGTETRPRNIALLYCIKF